MKQDIMNLIGSLVVAAVWLVGVILGGALIILFTGLMGYLIYAALS